MKFNTYSETLYIPRLETFRIALSTITFTHTNIVTLSPSLGSNDIIYHLHFKKHLFYSIFTDNIVLHMSYVSILPGGGHSSD